MRIAFVGKGGSGKTTLAALFAQYLNHYVGKPIFLVDADVNMHIGDMINTHQLDEKKHLSSPSAQHTIKHHIKGQNKRIVSIDHIKKTTPPTKDSGFFDITDTANSLFRDFTHTIDNIHLAVVGTYTSDGIGASCYHNNLSIFENILSHSIDRDAYIVADMVAGTDAFAGTLHAQFDMLVLSVEPTKKSVAVYTQYYELAQAASIQKQLYVVGNKVRTEADEAFIMKHIPQDTVLACVPESDHIRAVEQGMDALTIQKVDPNITKALEAIHTCLTENTVNPTTRLKKLHQLHNEYVAQSHIRERFGDLTGQIDPTFDLDAFIHDHV